MKKIGIENPHQDIGKSKFRVRRQYTCWVEYDVIAKDRDEAEEAVSQEGGIEKIEWQEGWYKGDPIEVYAGDYDSDYDAERDYEKYRGPLVTKIEECVPYEDRDIDTDEDILDYTDPEWTSDEYRWKTNSGDDQNGDADASSNHKDKEKDEIPF